MLPNHRIPAAAGVGALMAGVLGGCAVLADPDEPEPMVVVADLSLSGADGARGQVYRDALELRVEQVNQRGFAGDRRLELRVADNRSDPETSVANLTDRVADPAVAAVVTGGCEACAVAVAEVAEAAGVPTVALAAADAVAQPVAQRRYVFRLGPESAVDADVLAGELSAAGVATAALVTGDDEYGAEGRREMGEAAAAGGVELVVQERVALGGGADDDGALAAVGRRIAGWAPPPEPFPAEPPQTGRMGPEAVVLWVPEAEAVPVAAGLREAGWSGELYLDAVAAGGLFLDRAASEALGRAWMVFTETLVIDDVIAVTPAKAQRQEWFGDYLSRYGTYHAHASFAADAVDLLVAAVVESGSDGREPVRDAIEAMRVDGLSGPIGFSPGDHSGLDQLAVTLVVAGDDRWRLPVT